MEKLKFSLFLLFLSFFLFFLGEREKELGHHRVLWFFFHSNDLDHLIFDKQRGPSFGWDAHRNQRNVVLPDVSHPPSCADNVARIS